MDLVDRCLQTLAQGNTSLIGRAWRAALDAATAGDAAATVRALDGLAERERFVAMLVLGLAFPAVRREAAIAYDEAVAPDTKAIDWQWFCESALVERWAIAADDVSPDVLGGLLGRAYYGSGNRVALAVVRDRLARGRVQEAVQIHALMHDMGKDDRGAARAAIGRAIEDDSHLLGAIREAECEPMIQSGGEETQALGAVLREFIGLPADHAAVTKCVQRLLHWGKTYAEKDTRSYGVAQGVFACVRGGWIDHARSLAEVVWNGDLRAQCVAAIESGVVEPEPARGVEEPTFDEIDKIAYADSRIFAATSRASCRLDAGDRDGAFASLLFGIDKVVSAEAGIAEKAAWARALAAGGRRDDALAAVTAIVGRDLPAEACALAVELLGTDARPFVERALEHELELVEYSTSYAKVDEPATYLARLVARVGAPDLEERLLRAVAVIREYEDREHAEVAKWRVRRITEVLRELANAYPELGGTPAQDRLDAWTAAVGDKTLMGAAAAALANEPLPAILARVGTLRPQHAGPLAIELVRRGRLADALEIVTPLEPWLRQAALVDIAGVCTAPKDRQKVLAAFKKCPKTSRDRDAQGVWKHRFARVHLAAGDLDGAIEILVAMQDCRISGFGPGPLAREIAKHLDEDPARWTAARTTALLDVVASPNVHPQDTLSPTLAIVPSALVHHRDIALAGAAKIRTKLRQGGDAALVVAAEALGHTRAGDRAVAAKKLGEALTAASTQRAFYADASSFMTCVTDVDHRDELWLQAFELGRNYEPRDVMRAVERIFDRLDPADAPLAARAIAATKLPREVADHARDLLADFVADRLDTDELFSLDTGAILRRVRQAARFLARRGQHADAMRLARASGLAS